MLNELKIIRNIFIRLVLAFFLFTGVFLFVTLPWLGGTPAEWAVEHLRAQFVPPDATLAVMGPLDAFFALASVSALMACALLIPMFLFELWRFVAPALTVREEVAFGGGLLTSLFLSGLGAYFAYAVLVPSIFSQLFVFIPPGVEPIFNLQHIVSLVAGLILGTALVFLLPLAMVLLSFIGLIPARIWAAYARPAILLVLIVSAIITPDGSGVGMILLSVPVCALYGVGYGGAVLVTNKQS